MAQAKGSESTQSQVLSSIGAVVVSEAPNYIADLRNPLKKYGTESLRRLEVLIEIYKTYYNCVPNNFDLDRETKRPLAAFINGNWEQHCQNRFSEKETTALRVDVENILKIISSFLDARREDAGPVKSLFFNVYKGDIEEKFFSEMIDWTIRCLDCNADEDIVKVIDERVKYLRKVMDDEEVFPEGSSVFPVIREIRDILIELMPRAKAIHEKEFVLNKFKYISTLSESLMSHFLEGFSYFSSGLRSLKRLNHQHVSGVAKKSKSRYDNLFLLFLENAFIGYLGKSNDLSDDILKNAGLDFDPVEFQQLMLDESKKSGISVQMSVDIRNLIPEIFMDAYNLSIGFFFNNTCWRI